LASVKNQQLGTGHYLWQGWGPKRKYNEAGKNHYPTFFETKFLATPPVECQKIFLPHPNLFCCNVKGPDIKYVMKQFSILYAYYSSWYKIALDG
jgi:hypothetical protein